MLKKLLYVLVFVLSAALCYSQADTYLDVTEEFLPSQTVEQKQNTSLKNSQNNSTNLNQNSRKQSQDAKNLNNSYQTQDYQSMSALELLDNLETQYQNLILQVETLESLSTSLKAELENSKNALNSSLNNCKELKAALLSNKEDTSAAILIAGEMQEQLDKYKEYIASMEKRLNENHFFVNITYPTLFVAGIVTGIGSYLLFDGAVNNNSTKLKTGAIMGGVGLAAFVGVEIAFNIGRVKFRLW